METPSKRRKIDGSRPRDEGHEGCQGYGRSVVLNSRKSISPPARRKRSKPEFIEGRPVLMRESSNLDKENSSVESTEATLASSSFQNGEASASPIDLVPSPVQLIAIKDLHASLNIDTISLKDILGDPLIKECWLFNYLFDVDFVMSQFDEDIRDLVQVKIVHGSWKKDAPNKIRIDEAVKSYSNIQTFTAYMPEMYGTHHSKMIILFRHDNQAQVIIMTANMIAIDWRMTQAVWRSPLLPLQEASNNQELVELRLSPLGSGTRFKHDLLAYLSKYETRTKSVVAQLCQYEFSSIRAVLVASTPGKQKIRYLDQDTEGLWGWPALKRVLGGIAMKSSSPHIVIQVSSVASVGEKWLSNTFFDVLSSSSPSSSAPKINNNNTPQPRFSIVFPTADEIRRSIDGYSAGGSIHMKVSSPAQKKQVEYIRPMLCHWAGDSAEAMEDTTNSLLPEQSKSIRKAGRRRASPHIKTFIRFSDAKMTSIDWALLTSANLSTQAWGAAPNSNGEVRISSYEIGVLVWPALWDKPGSEAQMVPVFGKDLPVERMMGYRTAEIPHEVPAPVTVGWRMPYDLPLVSYARDEMPWFNNEPCDEADCMGRTWPGI